MNHADLMPAIKLMAQGMTGIFIVMAVIYVVVSLLIRFSNKD